MSSFHISKSNPSHIHLKWNNALKPILTVDSGAELSFDLLDGGHNQLTDRSTVADVSNFNFDLGDPAHGPVYINSAEPGDVLKIEFLELEPASYGWTAIFPGHLNFGLLADEFPDPGLKIWDLETHRRDGYTVFKEGIHIPIKPFLGLTGLALSSPGEFSTIPPYDTGGNLDCKALTLGSTLYLPIRVRGALLSCGDGHAAQGDGEVCGTAIETPMRARLRLSVEKGMPWVESPHYVLPAEESDAGAGGRGVTDRDGNRKDGGEKKGEYAAIGIDADLREASRKALRGLIGWLEAEKGLSRAEAYMLASVAADLKIAEAVDMPHYAVACSLPLGIFVEAPYL